TRAIFDRYNIRERDRSPDGHAADERVHERPAGRPHRHAAAAATAARAMSSQPAGEGFEPPRALRPGGFQVPETVGLSDTIGHKNQVFLIPALEVCLLGFPWVTHGSDTIRTQRNSSQPALPFQLLLLGADAEHARRGRQGLCRSTAVGWWN